MFDDEREIEEIVSTAKGTGWEEYYFPREFTAQELFDLQLVEN